MRPYDSSCDSAAYFCLESFGTATCSGGLQVLVWQFAQIFKTGSQTSHLPFCFFSSSPERLNASDRRWKLND